MQPARLAALASCILSAAAHGWVQSITVAGTLYAGNGLGSGGGPSVIRQVDTNSPVTNVNDPDLACGPNAQKAVQVAAANPGDAIQVDWVSTAGAWFHNVGPMLTYLADCGGSCTDFDASNAMWFKIQQVGRDPASHAWAQAALNSGASASLNLPSNIAPGQYLMRHEIIALQNGGSQGGAEFYASCSQLAVAGSGSGKPTSAELVKIPGAYSATDSGILIDVYSNTDAPYTFPGPPIAAFVGSTVSEPTKTGSPASHSGTTTATTRTTSARSGTPTRTSTDGDGLEPTMSICKLRRVSPLSTRARHARRWHRALRPFK